jgi:hypothetical protein
MSTDDETDAYLRQTHAWGLARLGGALGAATFLEEQGCAEAARLIPGLREVMGAKQRKIMDPEPYYRLYGRSALGARLTDGEELRLSNGRPLSRKQALKVLSFYRFLGADARMIQTDTGHKPTYVRSCWIVQVSANGMTTWVDRDTSPLPPPTLFGMLEKEALGAVHELVDYSRWPFHIATLPAAPRQEIGDDPGTWYVIVKVPGGAAHEGSSWVAFYDRDELAAWLAALRVWREEAEAYEREEFLYPDPTMRADPRRPVFDG